VSPNFDEETRSDESASLRVLSGQRLSVIDEDFRVARDVSFADQMLQRQLIRHRSEPTSIADCERLGTHHNSEFLPIRLVYAIKTKIQHCTVSGKLGSFSA
jgi:hypothetical protein